MSHLRPELEPWAQVLRVRLELESLVQVRQVRLELASLVQVCLELALQGLLALESRRQEQEPQSLEQQELPRHPLAGWFPVRQEPRSQAALQTGGQSQRFGVWKPRQRARQSKRTVPRPNRR